MLLRQALIVALLNKKGRQKKSDAPLFFQTSSRLIVKSEKEYKNQEVWISEQIVLRFEIKDLVSTK